MRVQELYLATNGHLGENHHTLINIYTIIQTKVFTRATSSLSWYGEGGQERPGCVFLHARPGENPQDQTHLVTFMINYHTKNCVMCYAYLHSIFEFFLKIFPIFQE